MLFLESALSAAKMGHFFMDPHRRIIEFSPWVRENIGLPDAPIALENLPDIIVPHERETFRQTVETIIREEEQHSFETQVVTAKGTQRTQRITVVPAYEEDTERVDLIGFFGILQEVTTQKEAEQDLLKARDEARAELAARTNILAAVSHEIRTPLGGVLGIIDQLKRERSAVERERALALIEDSCEVLLETLDAILQQSRLGQSGDGLADRVFSPRAVANRVAELFKPVARRKALQIHVKASSALEARGDDGFIRQALANLVSNAIKFTQTGGVTLTVIEPATGESEWTFIVSDTGAGMDAKRLEGLFEPFGQSSDDTLGRSTGAGLGLSITRDLVEAMGGRIEVRSELGKGTSFQILVPLGEPREAALKADSAPNRGCVALLFDRASDQVQAEAVVAKLGYSICDLADHDAAPLPCTSALTIIADADLLPQIDDAMLNSSRLTVAVGDASSEGAAQPKEGLAFIERSQLARSLVELLERELS